MPNRITDQDRINGRLKQIHDRLSHVAGGEFEPERDRLIAETDRLLDRMGTIIGTTRPI